VDNHTLEVDLSKNQNMNDVFSQLTAQGVEVLSMRNKSNRLEALFVSLIDKNSKQAPKQEVKS
jgi:ABC-2 type transport system ATP-binding protein